MAVKQEIVKSSDAMRHLKVRYVSTDCSGEDWTSMTDPSHASSCDVNRIVDSFMKTGVLPGTNVGAVYGDFSDVPDFLAAQEIVMKAMEQFDSLDAKVRKRFDNDPSKFLAFVNTAGNERELRDLGLLEPDAKLVASDSVAGQPGASGVRVEPPPSQPDPVSAPKA